MATGQGRSDAYGAARRTDRPRRHTGSSEPEAAIMRAGERLLAQIPLAELSVADILAESGVSRATFYFYFSSKFAVVSSLLAQLYDQMFESVGPYVSEEPRDPVAALRASIEAAAAFWHEHAPALRAVHEHWPMVPELREAWLEIIERFTQAVAARIDAERTSGSAPAGLASRELASSLLWGTDRCMYIAGLGVDRHLPSEAHSVEAVLALWVGSIYGAGAGRGGERQRP
jgi:AcrR family transcriptional regulator